MRREQNELGLSFHLVATHVVVVHEGVRFVHLHVPLGYLCEVGESLGEVEGGQGAELRVSVPLGEDLTVS